MGGVKAPRDAEKSRPYFYIMREKEIFGTRQTTGEAQGKGIQFIYENDGRLKSSAQVAGNITDEQILEMLDTTEGFRKLVHSIGVSVETQDPLEEVTFVFQMYGKKDSYGGGTLLSAKLIGNGAETRIGLENILWSEDDDVPGQIRIVLQTPEQLAKISVRFYVQDGFCIPKQTQEHPIEMSSKDYKNMIAHSLLSMGNWKRMKEVIERAKAGEDVTLAYLGGSITQGAGATPIHTECYAYQSFLAFSKKYGTGKNVHLIKEGVGGTPSELGMIRFERDVLRDGTVEPDLVVVEFAVNDEGDETKGVCYESLIRKIEKLQKKPAIVLLFSVFADDYNLQERLAPIGYHYQLPMVSIKDAVTPQFSLADGKGRVLSKNQYFYDAYHPTNLGHKIMADCLSYFWQQADLNEMPHEAACHKNVLENAAGNPLLGAGFENVKLLDKKDGYKKATILPGDFTGTDDELQCVELDDNLTATPEFPYNWYYDGTKRNAGEGPIGFQMKITCRALILVAKDSGEVDAGRAEIYADGEKKFVADPHINGWTHCNPLIIFTEEESREHEIVIEMVKEDWDKKFTILGFGYVE